MERLPETIESPRLLIRRWRPDDVDALMAAVAASVEHLRPWMPWVANEPMSRDDRLAMIDEWTVAWASGGDAVYGAFLRIDNSTATASASDEVARETDDPPLVMGGCGLHRRLGPGGLEIGYWTHADHVRRGYATEIAHALTTAAFADPDIDRIEIHHDRANEASAGIPRNLGFRYVGYRKGEPEAPAESGVECAWRTTRPEWFA